jgi:hypothetical protein
VDRENVVDKQDKVLFNHKEEQNYVTCRKMNEKNKNQPWRSSG